MTGQNVEEGDSVKPWAEWFYKGKAWQQCRRAYFLSQHGVCERCGQPGRIVHHRKRLTPANVHDPNVTLDWRNLELLCDECHQREHQGTANAASGARFNENGMLVPVPPPSGNGIGNNDHATHMRIPRFSLFKKIEEKQRLKTDT